MSRCKIVFSLLLLGVVSLFTVLAMFVLIIHNLGCLEGYSFIYFVMLFAVLYKQSKENDIQKESTEEKFKGGK